MNQQLGPGVGIRVRGRAKALVQRSPADTEEYRVSAKILEGWPPLKGNDTDKLEYIKTLVALAADDMKHVTVYISVAFGVTAVLLSGKAFEALQGSPMWVRLAMVLGIVSLAISAIFFYRYVRRMHLTRMAIARCIPSLQTERARELWAGAAGVWSIHGRAYNVGLLFLFLGFTFEGITAVCIIM